MASNPTSVRNKSAEESAVKLLPAQSLLQDITGTSPLEVSYNSSEPKHTSATLFILGVDDKTRSNIHAGEYVKFSSLLPSDSNSPAKNHYRSLEQDGQLVFFKSNEKDPINTITKQTEAYQVYVAILAEKYPLETGTLMVYAQTVQKLPSHVGTKLLFNRTKSFVVGDKRIHLLVLGNLKILNCFSTLFNIHPSPQASLPVTIYLKLKFYVTQTLLRYNLSIYFLTNYHVINCISHLIKT